MTCYTLELKLCFVFLSFTKFSAHGCQKKSRDGIKGRNKITELLCFMEVFLGGAIIMLEF